MEQGSILIYAGGAQSAQPPERTRHMIYVLHPECNSKCPNIFRRRRLVDEGGTGCKGRGASNTTSDSNMNRLKYAAWIGACHVAKIVWGSEEWRSRSSHVLAVHVAMATGALCSSSVQSTLGNILALAIAFGLSLCVHTHAGRACTWGMLAIGSVWLRCTLSGCIQSMCTCLAGTTVSALCSACSCAIAVSRLRPGHVVELSGIQWSVLSVCGRGALLVEVNGDGMVLGSSDGLQVNELCFICPVFGQILTATCCSAHSCWPAAWDGGTDGRSSRLRPHRLRPRRLRSAWTCLTGPGVRWRRQSSDFDAVQ